MPVDATHHRTITGRYHQKSLSQPCSGNARLRGDNPPNTGAPGVEAFPTHFNHIRNATDRLPAAEFCLASRRASPKITLMQLLLLLSQLHPAERSLLAGRLPQQINTALTPAADAAATIMWYDPLRFPAVAAQQSVVPLPASSRQWSAQGSTYRVDSEQVKQTLFSQLTQRLVSSGQLSAEQAQSWELSLRITAAGRPLLLFPLEPAEKTPGRSKRISEKDDNARIAAHIREHCAIEEEVLNTEGKNEGKVLLFEAQRAENPFRRFYDNSTDIPSSVMRGITDGLNIAADILSLGLKYLVGKIVAHAKRRSYYQQQGDEICAERYKRLMLAEVATSLDVGAQPFIMRSGRPAELRRALPLQNNAAWYARNPQTGIRREILLELKRGQGTIDDGGSRVYLKPGEKDNEFYTWYPDAVKPESLKRRVIVDEDTLSWRYADTFDGAELNVQISEGKKQIYLHGEYYELHQNARQEYQIVLPQPSGTTAYIPVYMEPLSKTWHLSLQNDRAVFSARQQEIISQLSVKPDPDFHYVPSLTNNQQYYGNGQIWWQEKKGDHSHYPWGTFIEMNGKMLPVRNVDHAGPGELYEVWQQNILHVKGYPVEFDGLRWKFERQTSEHVSRGLKSALQPEKRIQIVDTRQLSAPDNRGLRWSKQQDSYLKIEGYYVKILKLNGNRYAVPATAEHPRLLLRYKKDKFFIESAQERLKNLMTVGLSGRKRRQPQVVLEQLDGFTPESASRLLDDYDFPEKGFYTAWNFALEIEQTGRLPRWAERFLKKPLFPRQTSQAHEVVMVTDSGIPERTTTLKLGRNIGSGITATVSEDATDNAWVIKKYSGLTDNFSKRMSAEGEAKAFRDYYGEEAATVWHDTNGQFYVRMYRVPGKSLDDVRPGELPTDAIQRYVDMLERLTNAGIMHDDLHSGNVLWDAAEKKFHPIDIFNMRDDYFKQQSVNAENYNFVEEFRWNAVMKNIGEKMVNPAGNR